MSDQSITKSHRVNLPCSALAALLLVAGVREAAAAGDASAGEKIFQSQCAVCHSNQPVTPGWLEWQTAHCGREDLSIAVRGLPLQPAGRDRARALARWRRRAQSRLDPGFLLHERLEEFRPRLGPGGT